MPPLPEDLDRLLHDLRGPLNAAVMHLEVIRRRIPEDDAAHASVDTIQQELLRLATLLPTAFSVVALERGELTAVNLRDLVERALKAQGLHGVVLAESPWPDVRVDERLVGLAVAHLARNALQATAAARASRPPRVSASPTGTGQVALTVRDWGGGLRSTNPKVLVRLTGVGLVTAERVARLHGGALSFAAPGEGAEVTLTIPAA
jgi:signal transduction histidine kinase